MPERTESIQKLLHLHQPDILCLQELRETTRDLIDQTLSDHSRVDDSFAGWIGEGNIYFNSKMFELKQYGAENIGMYEADRRLFWTRLTLKGKKGLQVAWNKGKKFSIESRMRMSLSQKGKVPWNKGLKGVMIAWNKGKRFKKNIYATT